MPSRRALNIRRNKCIDMDAFAIAWAMAKEDLKILLRVMAERCRERPARKSGKTTGKG